MSDFDLSDFDPATGHLITCPIAKAGAAAEPIACTMACAKHLYDARAPQSPPGTVTAQLPVNSDSIMLGLADTREGGRGTAVMLHDAAPPSDYDWITPVQRRVLSARLFAWSEVFGDDVVQP